MTGWSVAMAETVASVLSWDALKARGHARAEAIGLPEPKRSEDWRYVDVAPLSRPPAHAPRGADPAVVRNTTV